MKPDAHQLDELRCIHREINSDIRWASSENPLSLDRLARQMSEAIAVLGGFCNGCSGSGEVTYDVPCCFCNGKGAQ